MSDSAADVIVPGTPASAVAAAVPAAAEAEEDEVEEVPPPPAAQASARASEIQPAVVYDVKTSAEYDVRNETIAAVEAFVAPAGWEQAGTREQSFMFSLGNFIKPQGLKPKKRI